MLGQRRRVTVAGASVVAPTKPTLTAPGAVDVYPGVAVTVSATVTAGQVPDRVDFVLDPGVSEIVVATDSSSPYSQSWTPAQTPGNHTLVARFVYGSGHVDSDPTAIAIWQQVLLDPTDLTTANWSEFNLSARTATTITEDNATGLHCVEQVPAGLALAQAAHYHIALATGTGDARYAAVFVNNGDHKVYVDRQTETIQSASAGITNAAYAGGILSFDYTPAVSKNTYLSCSDGTQTQSYAGNGTRSATFAHAWIFQAPP